MKDMNFFSLLYTYLAEHQTNNIYENLKQDKEYLNATNLEEELRNTSCYKHYVFASL